MGVVMGHEITHAFDDSGREYDKYGNLKQWWNNDTIGNFNEEVQCMVEQYEKFDVHGEPVSSQFELKYMLNQFKLPTEKSRFIGLEFVRFLYHLEEYENKSIVFKVCLVLPDINTGGTII